MTDNIDIVDTLIAQVQQLKRLLNHEIWVSQRPKPTREEITAQVGHLKSLITQLEESIQQRR
jgi:flagellar biosynthesis/type III secretory pathway chaperone